MIAGRDPAFVEVSVHNSGSPIPPDVQKTIFQSWTSEQLDAPERDQHLELGLYIARLITEAHLRQDCGHLDRRGPERRSHSGFREPDRATRYILAGSAGRRRRNYSFRLLLPRTMVVRPRPERTEHETFGSRHHQNATGRRAARGRGSRSNGASDRRRQFVPIARENAQG
jgi:hypothetical protein